MRDPWDASAGMLSWAEAQCVPGDFTDAELDEWAERMRAARERAARAVADAGGSPQEQREAAMEAKTRVFQDRELERERRVREAHGER